MITPLSEALAERGFDTLTPVQQAVIAPELATQDLLVSAQTGSGKTVGFGLAIAPTLLGEAERFGAAEAPLAIAVAPTRELAMQVMRELSWLYAKAGAVVTSCVGGMDMRQERRSLERGAHIVVGTPGRLRDHIERGSLDLSAIRAVVLDEADEMLDLGFREDLEFMLEAAPEDRRTLLFSATVPPMIARLAEQFQRDAQRINTVNKAAQHSDISYQALQVAASDADHAIFNLLRFHDEESAIVFANTRAEVNHLTARLSNRGLAVVSLSGELSQSERTHALQAMRDGRARVCVATDVAARGIDLPNLNLVIHADLPTNTESLLHRSGRTGRAGRKGISALIVPMRAAKKAERLLKWAKINAEWTTPPSVEDILARDEERLLNDPSWNDPLTEDQQAFAQKLLAVQSPEVIAAAYLRLHQSRHAAPEELLPPDAPSPRKPREEFGPSRWFALSVGRKDNAEPRWLLPMICRVGDLDKTAIGAIRVQDAETFVELTEASAAGFMSALGDGGTLEDGVVVRALDSAPDLPPARRNDGPRGPRRDGDGPRKGPRRDNDGPRGPRRDFDSDGPRGPRRDRDGDSPRGPRAPRPERAERDEAVHRELTPRKPRAKKAEGGFDDRGPKPKKDWGGRDGDKPKGKFGDKPKGGFGDKPKGKFGDKPKGKFGDKPAGKTGEGFGGKGKPKGKFGDKPFGDKPKGKGEGKPGKPKAGGKPGYGTDARDSSKRFTPPGGAKPGARKPRAGANGSEPPRRKG